MSFDNFSVESMFPEADLGLPIEEFVFDPPFEERHLVPDDGRIPGPGASPTRDQCPNDGRCFRRINCPKAPFQATRTCAIAGECFAGNSWRTDNVDIHSYQEAGFNCLVRKHHSWSRFLIAAIIKSSYAGMHYLLTDGTGLSSLRIGMEIGSKIAAWRRDEEWAGVGGNEKVLRALKKNASVGEHIHPRFNQDWREPQDLSVAQVVNQSIRADQHIMVRASVYAHFDWVSDNYRGHTSCSISAKVAQIRVLGYPTL